MGYSNNAEGQLTLYQWKHEVIQPLLQLVPPEDPQLKQEGEPKEEGKGGGEREGEGEGKEEEQQQQQQQNQEEIKQNKLLQELPKLTAHSVDFLRSLFRRYGDLQSPSSPSSSSAIGAFSSVTEPPSTILSQKRISERLQCYHQMVETALSHPFLKMNAHSPTVIVASPGRNRIYMGHTDFPGN